MKKHKFQPLDVVRTSFGTICVVNDVSTNGDVSLVLPKNSTQKTAWFVLQRIRWALKHQTIEKMDGDIEIDESGITLIVNKQDLVYLQGMEIDYKKEQFKEGFELFR